MTAPAPACAISRAVVVIHSLDRESRRAAVASVAAQARAGEQLGLVGNVVRRLRQARSPGVVTGCARSGDNAGVIETGRQPRAGAMTLVARGRRGHVLRRFPGGGAAVVAARAGPGSHGGVVEARGNPGAGPMA